MAEPDVSPLRSAIAARAAAIALSFAALAPILYYMVLHWKGEDRAETAFRDLTPLVMARLSDYVPGQGR